MSSAFPPQQYDNFYRLKTFKFGGATQRTYAYDDNGNFESFAGRTFEYENDNNQMTDDGVRSYEFDASGRVKKIASTSMSYDIFNNMLTYGNDSYSYDDANQRLKKTESGTTTYYIRDGLNTLAEYEGGDLVAEYVHDDRGLVMKIDDTPEEFWYVTDHLGSTRRLESSSMQRDYYPFGEDYTAMALRFSSS